VVEDKIWGGLQRYWQTSKKCTISWVSVGWRCYGWLVKTVTAKTSCSDYFNRALSLSLGGRDDLFHLFKNFIGRLGCVQLVNQVQLFKVPGKLMLLQGTDKQFSLPPYDRHCCLFIGDKSFAETLLIVICSSATCCAPAQASAGKNNCLLSFQIILGYRAVQISWVQWKKSTPRKFTLSPIAWNSHIISDNFQQADENNFQQVKIVFNRQRWKQFSTGKDENNFPQVKIIFNRQEWK